MKKLDFESKSRQLYELYDEFTQASQPFTASAVCRAGCADCCITVGSVDITTLEGIVIMRHMQSLPLAAQKDFARRLKQNRKVKLESKFARCAFLLANNTCSIYPVRPFSCRRLYSVRVCGETGPTVHRQMWELAEKTLTAIQSLDHTGYSGHMSYILQLLSDAGFRKTYMAGEFSPGDVRDFARKHGILINRFLRSPEK